MSKPSSTTKGSVHADWPRFVVLVIASVVGMALLGAASFTTAVRGEVSLWWGGLVLAMFVGAAVGFCSMPFVVGWLKEANLWKSLPAIYGAGLIVTVLWTLAIPAVVGLTAAIPAYVTVVVMTRWCASRFAIPRVLEPSRFCPKCGYDLRDRYLDGCPECGWRRSASAKTRK